MHRAILRQTKEMSLKKSDRSNPDNSQIKVEALVLGQTKSALSCPIQTPRSFVVTGDLRNAASDKCAQGIEFLIDTGCHFAVVIPAFVADQIGLSQSSPIRMFSAVNADGSAVESPVYEILLTINDIPIRTTATVSGTGAEKAIIGAELLSLFDLYITGEQCRLSLRSAKSHQ